MSAEPLKPYTVDLAIWGRKSLLLSFFKVPSENYILSLLQVLSRIMKASYMYPESSEIARCPEPGVASRTGPRMSVSSRCSGGGPRRPEHQALRVARFKP